MKALREQFAAAGARAERQAAELVADLAAEKAKTEKAIAAFSALAERLDALAAKRWRARGGGGWSAEFSAMCWVNPQLRCST